MEIIEALGKVDMLVCGAGTGGTVTGTGNRIKEKCPKCTVIVAEPEGSTMFNVNGKKHPFLVRIVSLLKHIVIILYYSFLHLPS